MGATCIVSAQACTVLGASAIQGLDTSSITFVSSNAKPPCSACFLVLPE
ncbi:MAG: hypothetical protein ACLQIB_50615 [Isosphaeraceae bacterium]